MRQDIRGRRKSESRNTQTTEETFFMNENDNESFEQEIATLCNRAITRSKSGYS